ncbi:hypothetical protein DID77_03690 [Candidatus Marinamargulisbacteria bacterium SCGC AG-439-L15]|nr:hypothetical protein DID77_03690 [Candidatus Marinamargulisbacteria bacterium SCGC AG-439-L15]
MLHKPRGAHILLFGVILIIASIASWQSIRAFLAERHFRDGYYLMQKRNSRFAIIELEKAVNYAKWEPHYRLFLGRAHEAYANETKSVQQKIAIYKKIIPIYEKIIAQSTTNPWYKSRLAFIYAQLAYYVSTPQEKAFYKEKEGLYKKLAAKNDPENPIFQIGYAQFLHQQKQYTQAISYYKKVIEIDDRILVAPFNLGDIYIKQQKYDAAIEIYQYTYEKNKAFKKDTKLGSPTEFNKTAIALIQLHLIQKQPQKALSLTQDFLQQKPQLDFTSLQAIAYTYTRLQKHQDAINLYLMVKKDHPSFFPITLELSKLYHAKGQKEKARRVLKTYIKNYPKNTKEAKKQLKKLQ